MTEIMKAQHRGISVDDNPGGGIAFTLRQYLRTEILTCSAARTRLDAQASIELHSVR